MSDWEPVSFAAFGSVALKILDLLEWNRLPPERRPDLKDPVYWFGYIGSAFLAGILAYAYVRKGQPVKPLLAIHIGLTTPLILRAMANLVPPLPLKNVEPRNRGKS